MEPAAGRFSMRNTKQHRAVGRQPAYEFTALMFALSYWCSISRSTDATEYFIGNVYPKCFVGISRLLDIQKCPIMPKILTRKWTAEGCVTVTQRKYNVCYSIARRRHNGSIMCVGGVCGGGMGKYNGNIKIRSTFLSAKNSKGRLPNNEDIDDEDKSEEYVKDISKFFNEDPITTKLHHRQKDPRETKHFLPIPPIIVQDQRLLTGDMLTLLIVTFLLGMTDAVLSSDFLPNGGWTADVVPSMIPTSLNVVTKRLSEMGVAWVISSLKNSGYDHSATMSDDIALRSSVVVWVDHCSIRILLALLLAMSTHSAVDAMDLFRQVWFTLPIMVAFRMFYGRENHGDS